MEDLGGVTLNSNLYLSHPKFKCGTVGNRKDHLTLERLPSLTQSEKEHRNGGLPVSHFLTTYIVSVLTGEGNSF